MELEDLPSHELTFRRGKLGERVVEKKNFRLLGDGSSEGDAQALRRPESPSFQLKKRREIQEVGRIIDAAVGFSLCEVAAVQAEGKIFAHGEVWEERVAWENDGDIPILRGNAADVFASDKDAPNGDSKPAIMRRIVDFPQPDGPRSARNWLSAISRVKFFTSPDVLPGVAGPF